MRAFETGSPRDRGGQPTKRRELAAPERPSAATKTAHSSPCRNKVPSGSLRTSRSNRSTARPRDNHARGTPIVGSAASKEAPEAHGCCNGGQRYLASVLQLAKLIHYIGAKLKVPDKPAALRYFRMRGSILTSFLLYDPQAPNCSFTSTVRPRYFQAIGDANGCR